MSMMIMKMEKMMFKQSCDLDIRQPQMFVDDCDMFGSRNQEINNQTQQMKMMQMTNNDNFSKYFDVLLMHNANEFINVLMFVDDDDDIKIACKSMLNMMIMMMKDIEATIKDSTQSILPAIINMLNIPLLNSGYRILIIAAADGAHGVATLFDNNNYYYSDDDDEHDKTTLMAILNVVLSDKNSIKMLKIIQNLCSYSNNKKLTNNCKMEINTDNINFSYYCDDAKDYVIMFSDDMSVFLSQKNLDITTGSQLITMMIMYKLQSHLIQSFTVNDHVDENVAIDALLTEPNSTTSQSNTNNKSEYAFEKTLNYYINVATNDKFSFKANSNHNIMMMDSTSKLFSFIQWWYCNDGKSMTQHNQKQQLQKDSTIIDDDDDSSAYDDAGFMMISDEMQLKCQKSLLQSLKESDQQSGIVSNNNRCNTIKLYTNTGTRSNNIIDNDDEHAEMTIETSSNNNNMMQQTQKHTTNTSTTKSDSGSNQEEENEEPTTMNISELIFSHKNDDRDDNTVNITCDFNYLNYNIAFKSNDQIHNDKTSVKDQCYKQTTSNIASSLVDKSLTAPIESITRIDEMIECQRHEKNVIQQFHAAGRRLRLIGGGEGSLSGTSGWGSPPSNSASNQNANAGQWGAAAQQAPPQQSWNQAAAAAQQQTAGGQPPSQVQAQVQQQQNQAVGGAPGQSQQPGQPQKPLTPGGPPTGWNQPPQAPNPNQAQAPIPPVPGAVPGIVGGGTSAVAAKNQLEQLNSMREALFAQDGWGCQNVNQDTNWDVPGSPEPGPRGGDPASAAGQWKSHTVNNGTELWEANLRNGGQPPPQPVQKTPWNHTPTTNIGGTWGEDDDVADNGGSVWTGNQNTQQPPGWNQSGANTAGTTGAAPMWPATQGGGGVSSVNANIPKKENEWNAGVASNTSNWGDPRDPMRPSGAGGGGGGPIDIRNIDQRDPRAPGTVDMRMMEQREQMQGNLRGVTGRLNGSSDMWQHGGMGHGGQMPMNKIVGPGGATPGTGNNPQWPGAQVSGPKDVDMNKPGWGDSSPPLARRQMSGGNFDDGTSLWGSQNRIPGVESNWKGGQDPMGRNNFVGRNPIGAAGPGLPPNRLPIKPEGNSWNALHPGRNSWDEPHTPNWEEKSHLGGSGMTPWNEGPNAGGPIWNKNKPSWPDNNDINNEWPQQNKLGNASSEIIRSSKQFRILTESGGFKKDEAELALRSTNMNVEEAMELLQQQQRNSSGIEPWHHVGGAGGGGGGGGFDHSPFPGNRYPGLQTLPFPPNNQKLPNASGNAGPGVNIGGLNNLPMQLNKHLPHQAGTPAAFSHQAAAASQSGSQPSAHHLRNLVQQIQKAVTAGYLNHQILNQPLAPQTLQLLNSLLNTIQQLQFTQNSVPRNGAVHSIQVQMTINKQKQTIANLQQQIAQQQALYIKSQAGAGNTGGGLGAANEFLRQNSASGMSGMGGHNDPISSLENNLAGLGLKQDQSPYPSNTTSQQSRLNQWKLPSALDNKAVDPVDFSRAPGTTSKQSLPPTTPTSIGSMGIHNEPGTWSSGRNDAGGWPDSTIDTSENKDWPSTANQQSPAFTDLVPEFQPGKPWKGNQKNVEDDPSITPGSVARNPLSISAAKESDLFGSNTAKTSPNEILSSSTWSFNPSAATQQNFSSTMPKLGADSKANSWSDSTSDLWAAPSTISKTTSGPPPGLGASKNGGSAVASNEPNDWIGWNSGANASAGGNGAGNGTWFSTWLLLKNLTAQIDGSTLRTLCVQHGPLQHFHLYLNHGIALCKYNSREEASKAQQALNNCVLSNTTICAESPSESEVQNILSHLGVPGSQSGNGGNGNGNSSSVGAGANTTTWRPPSQQGQQSTWGNDWPSANPTINW